MSASSVAVVVELRRDGDAKRVDLAVRGGLLTIGRDAQNAVPLNSVVASRRHAEVDVRGADMVVRDVSMNGTKVGKTLLQRDEARVTFGTPITIGEYVVVIDRHAGRPSEARRGSGERRTERDEIRAEGGRRREPRPSERPARSEASDEAFSESARAASEARSKEAALRAEIHKKLLEHLDVGAFEGERENPALRSRVLVALRAIVSELAAAIPEGLDHDALVGTLADEALGLGPLEVFLADPTVNEIMVVDPSTIFVEQRGRLRRADARFTDDDRVRAAIERIVTPLGRRIDESVPLVDARLADGSRVNAVIRPLALRGSAITIRKFSRTPLTLAKLIEFGALTPRMATFLTRSVIAKKNIVIAGGTGSGKTTLLNALSGAIPKHERVVTIEDAAELQLSQPHVVSLETRPANMEGSGEYTIRDLVKNALRMRPDRIVVGECRGGEALDMLQAMNTGHDGSLTTTHANSPREAIARLETLVLMSGLDLPVRAIREQIANSVQLVVQQSRLPDGSRRVTSITEVVGIGDDGAVELVPIFEYARTGTGLGGEVLGEFRATGFLPTFLDAFLVMNLVGKEEEFL